MNGRARHEYLGYRIELQERDKDIRSFHKWKAVISLDGRYRDEVKGHTEIDALAHAKDWIDGQLDK